MNKVWMLFGTFDYEGDTLLAVCTSEEEVNRLKEYGEKQPDIYHNYGYDSTYVSHWTVGERSEDLPTKEEMP